MISITEELFARLAESARQESVALVDNGKSLTYKTLNARIHQTQEVLTTCNLDKQLLGLMVEPTLSGIIRLLACLKSGLSLALIDPEIDIQSSSLPPIDQCWADHQIKPQPFDCSASSSTYPPLNVLGSGEPLLILATSGTSDKPQWICHQQAPFLKKYLDADKSHRTLCLGRLDHIRGLDIVLYSLAAGGCLVLTAEDVRIDSLTQAIKGHNIEMVPATPSWMKWLSLQLDESITFDSVTLLSLGAESIDELALQQAKKHFPNARVVQKYGMTELGVLKTRTHPSRPQLIALDPTLPHAVRDNVLWVKPNASLLGVVGNSLTLEDGWLCTGDRVEQHGEWLQILGRDSAMIISGGVNISPEIVAECIAKVSGVRDCQVYGKPNPLLGEVVCADILFESSPGDADLQAVKTACQQQLPKSHWPHDYQAVRTLDITGRGKRRSPRIDIP